MEVIFLKDRIPWFGSHTGYDALTDGIGVSKRIKVVASRQGFVPRFIGSAYATLRGGPRKGASSLSECEFLIRRRWSRPETAHILFTEFHLEALSGWDRAPADIVGTIHQPASRWESNQLNHLGKLRSALVLYQRELSFFEHFVGPGRVRFVHHGADVQFFRPKLESVTNPPRLLFSGVHLRNHAMLERVVNEIVRRRPEIQFDFLVPTDRRCLPELCRLKLCSAIKWHAALNDYELRNLYQETYLMLLPMNDSGANTAVIEALASGLPIVTTDVGGIRDYGGGMIYPVVANNDDAAMIDLVLQYLDVPSLRCKIAHRCRRFAEETLAWPMVAQQHLSVYRELAA